ncbi:universal stress protein [Pedobacter sp. P351]|uniref:universal stress protein n=1 Tax=Pedobacter superstes TaxID=3133441 RepID=UPI0030AC07AB
MKTILLLTDFSKKAEHAAEYTFHLASRVKADILLYHAYTVTETTSLKEKLSSMLEELFSIEDESKKKIKALAHYLNKKTEEINPGDHKPSIKYLCKPGNVGNLGSTVKKILTDKKIWMIAMGAKTDDCLSNFIFGTNAYSVISNTTCPVLFIPIQASIKDLKRIAIATDLQYPELSPLSFLKDFKKAYDLEIVLAHVSVDSPVETSSGTGLVEVCMYDVRANIEYPKIPYTDIKEKEIHAELQQFSLKSEIDVLGVIHRKEDVFQRLFHSSTTKLLIDSAQLPLLVFPVSMKKISD